MNKCLYIHDKKNMEDTLTCPICLEIYKHPRNLLCGHSFCTTCLFMIKVNNSIICPICRNPTTFSNQFSLIDLNVNNIIVSIIDNSNLDAKKTIKRSKSVDSLLNIEKKHNSKKSIVKYYNNKLKKPNVIYSNSISIDNPNIVNNINIDRYNSYDCDRECCTFQ
tara:strand:- start:191 stop:682 length:492 start_codon:yes stop_codon:yes gene_type:complete